MKVRLTNNSNTLFALSNEFKEVPIFLAELEDCSTYKDMLNIINKYSTYRKWTLKLKTSNQIIYESSDRLNNTHYLIIKES